MKNLSYFIFFLTFLMVACGQTEQNASIVTKSEFFIKGNGELSKEGNIDNSLIGVWTNCATSFNGMTMTANVCKIIEFRRDMTGKIILPSNEERKFDWKRTDNLLEVNLSEPEKETHSTLSESPFGIQLTEDSLSFDLNLISKKTNAIYHLGRQKK
ncbi:hypothetical protein ACG2LH_15620 [Zhouia sp. PK063]|uniref:hypothetical protein n=1 Tax=Zhouia sp. PK063 TaxID=3373602 RepID=UPI00379D4B6B